MSRTRVYILWIVCGTLVLASASGLLFVRYHTVIEAMNEDADVYYAIGCANRYSEGDPGFTGVGTDVKVYLDDAFLGTLPIHVSSKGGVRLLWTGNMDDWALVDGSGRRFHFFRKDRELPFYQAYGGMVGMGSDIELLTYAKKRGLPVDVERSVRLGTKLREFLMLTRRNSIMEAHVSDWRWPDYPAAGTWEPNVKRIWIGLGILVDGEPLWQVEERERATRGVRETDAMPSDRL